MADGTLMDKIMALPKWLVILVAVVVVSLIGFFGIYYGLGLNKKAEPEQVSADSLLLDMPDAAVSEDSRTQLQTYRDGDVLGGQRNPVEDYWDQLGGDLVSVSDDGGMDALSSSGEYSEQEIRQMQAGLRTREEIDLDHQRRRDYLAGNTSSPSALSSGAVGTGMPKPMTQAQRDSAYFARMERAMEMASRYSASSGQQPPAVPVVDDDVLVVEEESERTLPQQKEESATLPTDSFDGNDIISSLDGPSSGGSVHQSSGRSAKPVKATFLKNEKLQSGQRVIIRLMQDLPLADGTVIPANTHITGTCNYQKRFNIDVKMLHYAGKMFPVDISVYDNDGTEGLYCPIVDEGKGKKAVKDVAGGVIGAAGQVAGSLLTGNPVLGMAASRSLSSITGSINTDGTMSVNVVAGYEFYVFENIKEDKK